MVSAAVAAGMPGACQAMPNPITGRQIFLWKWHPGQTGPDQGLHQQAQQARRYF
jgi:hypothetical protein